MDLLTQTRDVTSSGRFAAIDEALEDLAAGRMVVVVDDEDRENEGDLVMAAEFVTPAAINFMTRQAGGWICLTLPPQRCDELGLEMMTRRNESEHQTPFTITIEAREGVTTGISVADQARTMRTAIDPAKGRGDLVSPGHVRPLRARPGGVLERAGHTEAATDLARLAGCIPAGVICEIQNEDGTMARIPDLERYAAAHDLRLITIADLIAYRRRTETLVERVVETTMPTTFGDFTIVGYRSLVDGEEHVALVKGDVSQADDVLVRVHQRCLVGDVFHALRCDCGDQLTLALQMIEREGAGVVLYLADEPRGTGLLAALRAAAPQGAHDTVGAAARSDVSASLHDGGVGAQILADLGLGSIRLFTDMDDVARPIGRNRQRHLQVLPGGRGLNRLHDDIVLESSMTVCAAGG